MAGVSAQPPQCGYLIAEDPDVNARLPHVGDRRLGDLPRADSQHQAVAGRQTARSQRANQSDRRTALVPAGLARAAELTWERCVRATHAVYQEAAAKAANSLP